MPRAVPEFETLVVPLGSTWVSLARARGVFERDVLPAHLARTRWYPERSAKAIQPTLTSAIPFCDIGDNRPWLAFFEADAARRDRRAMCCRCRSNGCASTASAIIRTRSPPCARARAKERCWMSPPIRSSSRCCCEICANRSTVEESEQGTAAGIPADQPASPTGRSAAGAHPRGRDRQSNSYGAGRQRLCRQDLSQARARHQSRDRDRPFPHRSRGLRQYAGPARQRRTDRRRRQRSAIGDRACLRRTIRATPGP